MAESGTPAFFSVAQNGCCNRLRNLAQNEFRRNAVFHLADNRIVRERGLASSFARCAGRIVSLASVLISFLRNSAR
jgi:hypothetical protein